MAYPQSSGPPMESALSPAPSSNLQQHSRGVLAPPPSGPMPSTSTQAGVKRERDIDNDDVNKAPIRKKATISRKPCIVCTDDIPKNRFPLLPHKQDDNNKHSSDVCFKCFSEHLCVEVKNKGHEGVGCPQYSKALEESEIRKLASSWTYQEYVVPHHSYPGIRLTGIPDTLTKQPSSACNKKKSVTLARTPSVLGVRTGELHSTMIDMLTRIQGAYFARGDGNIFSCTSCKARYCLVCEVPFHEEQTCDEYQADAKRRSEDEQKSLDAVKKMSRPCPGQGCGVNIDKYEGCDHMTCETMQILPVELCLIADCYDRPEVQARILLAVLRSLQRSDRDLARWQLCTSKHLSLLHQQTTHLPAAYWLLTTTMLPSLALDGERSKRKHIIRRLR
jgi:hypothetical protein